LNESRVSVGAAQSRFNDISSMDVTGAGALFMSAEYAVKALIVEHYGFLPRPLRPTGSSPLASDRLMARASIRLRAHLPTLRNRAQRPLPRETAVRDLGLVVIEAGGSSA